MIEKLINRFDILNAIKISILLFVIFILADKISGKTKKSSGIVIGKVYVPAHVETYLDFEIVSNGKRSRSYPVVRTRYIPDDWKLKVNRNGDILSIDVNANVYYSKAKNQWVHIQTYYGYFTGWEYNSKVIN